LGERERERETKRERERAKCFFSPQKLTIWQKSKLSFLLMLMLMPVTGSDMCFLILSYTITTTSSEASGGDNAIVVGDQFHKTCAK
jgi:hypothetical protein